MVFKIGNTLYNSDDMLALDVDSNYLRLFLHLADKALFLQSFEQDRGIVVEKVSVTDARSLLARLNTTQLPDALAFHQVLEEIATSDRRSSDNAPFRLTNASA